MQKLMYILRLSLLTGSWLLVSPAVSGRACPGTPAPEVSEVPEVASQSGRVPRLLTPPLVRHRTRHLRREANPAAGFGRDYFRPHRRPGLRKPDSFGVRAQRWWTSHRPF